MKLVDFIVMCDPSIECELIANGNTIYSGRIGNVTARIMSGKVVAPGSASLSEDGILIIKIGEEEKNKELEGDYDI